MGTILNVCKDARKRIREIDGKLDEAIVAWKSVGDEMVSVEAYIIDKAAILRSEIKDLKGELIAIDNLLEKDSDVRSYYESVYRKYEVFLRDTEDLNKENKKMHFNKYINICDFDDIRE